MTKLKLEQMEDPIRGAAAVSFDAFHEPELDEKEGLQ